MMIDGVLHRSVAVADPRQSACRCHSRHIRNGGHSGFIAFGTRPVSASKNSVPGARDFSAEFDPPAPGIRDLKRALYGKGFDVGGLLLIKKKSLQTPGPPLEEKIAN